MWLLVVIGLAGCAGVNAIHGQAREIAPQSLAFEPGGAGDGVFAPGAWPRADWWSMFGDPKLDSLVERAFAGNPSLRATQARVRAAVALSDAAGSALYPTLDLNASATRQRLSGNDILYPPQFGGAWINQGRVSLDFNYEFDFWGKHRDELDAALGEARAAAADSAAARLVLAAAVAQTYFQLETDLAAAALARRVLSEREGLQRLNRERVDRGLAPQLVVRQAEQQVASARVGLAAAQAAVQLDRHQLAALLGAGPGTALEVQPALRTYDAAIALPAHLPADLLARRPDLAAARARAEAAAARIGAARADFYPNIDLAAFVGLEAAALGGLDLFSSASRVAGIGPALHLPVFDAGRLKANLRGRYAEYDQAVEQYNQTLVDALRQVADQIASLRAVKQQLADQSQAVAAAEDAYRLTLERYRAGLTSYLDVFVNEDRLVAEQLNSVRLQGRSLALDVETIRALGGGYRAPQPAAHRS